MDKIEDGLKAFWGGVVSAFRFFAAPLEWCASLIGRYPKGALIVWVASIALTAWVF